MAVADAFQGQTEGCHRLVLKCEVLGNPTLKLNRGVSCCQFPGRAVCQENDFHGNLSRKAEVVLGGKSRHQHLGMVTPGYGLRYLRRAGEHGAELGDGRLQIDTVSQTNKFALPDIDREQVANVILVIFRKV